ncbi:hypothetical protein Franean1_3420 [Parafrankia sp. EAN1pec]|uniref:transposase n=1 Tax=Parafrankia sp. (strain EAN1pec) TaxID=298653 RepID=UPI00015D9C93|nr:hypothetical protein Franean1_3420 [Frankia sp. EAN1pec]
MLPDFTLPSSLAVLLAGFRPCFTAPTFEVFRALVGGTLAQTGRRTVCGMLVGAGLSRVWPHDRAHRFFSAARWCPDQVGLALARLVVRLLVGDGQPVLVAVDDTRQGPPLIGPAIHPRPPTQDRLQPGQIPIIQPARGHRTG